MTISVNPASDEVLSEVKGRLGLITLNRPKTLNALNLHMVEQLQGILSVWAVDTAVDAVLIRSSSGRAFCAGGDVRSIGILSDPEERVALGRAFFGTEYRVNYLINTFRKPFIALINGIAMGGGLGLSIHGSYRVVSEDLRMAMPETILGLFPDVGGTWFLNRCAGAVGRYLALIGPQLNAADALTAGLATHHVPAASFGPLVNALAEAPQLDSEIVDAIINRFRRPAEVGSLAERRKWIDDIFSHDALDRVIAEVDAHASATPWIQNAQLVIRRASPTSLRATWRRIVEGKDHSIARVLVDDFRMAVRIVGGHDFPEGVRAILVDKDQSPRWVPSKLAEVTDHDIDTLLAPLPEEAGMNGSFNETLDACVGQGVSSHRGRTS